MKLYHATPIQNKDNIINCGLVPGMYSPFDRWIKQLGIYGFTTIEHALIFAKDQCWNGGIAIFSFEADDSELILDPEYIVGDDELDLDYGIAYFLKTEISINAILEKTIEY
jgi:hypothetical protein